MKREKKSFLMPQTSLSMTAIQRFTFFFKEVYTQATDVIQTIQT